MFCRTAGWIVALACAAPAWAQLPPDQTAFDQLVTAAGATNGGAQACGGSEPDIAQHQTTAAANLKKFAEEFRYKLDRYDATFAAGQQEGREMMAQMRRTNVDGCSGVLQSLQAERTMSYRAFKQAVAEVADGLPEKKD